MIERTGRIIRGSVRNINQTYKTLETGFDAYPGFNKFLVSLSAIEELTFVRNHENIPPAMLPVVLLAASAPAVFSMVFSYYEGRYMERQEDLSRATFANGNRQLTNISLTNNQER